MFLMQKSVMAAADSLGVEESGLMDCKVIATGGLGQLVKNATDIIDVYDPNLTMYGLQIIYEKTKKAK